MILNGRVYTVRKRVYHLIPQYHNKWSDTVRQGIITLGEGASIGGIFLNLYLEKMVYMIYLTGDTHGGMDAEKLFPENFSGEGLTKNDYVIILGDFGFIWKYNPNKAEKRWMKFFETRPWTTLFIDGNHEGFTRLNSYPVTQWNGGNVHIINDSVIHLMRGQVFNIEGKTFFTMGGAESYDKQYRTIGLSWWQEEIPSYSEIEEGFRNLNKHNNTVDYVLTHTSPSRFVHQMIDYADATDPTHKMLDTIEETITFKHWFYGHWHIDMQFDDKFTCLYNSIINLNKY